MLSTELVLSGAVSCYGLQAGLDPLIILFSLSVVGAQTCQGIAAISS